jgi:hypothetical protein
MHFDLTSLVPVLSVFAAFIAHIISDQIKSSRHGAQIGKILGMVAPYIPDAQAVVASVASVSPAVAKAAPEIALAEKLLVDVAKQTATPAPAAPPTTPFPAAGGIVAPVAAVMAPDSASNNAIVG